MPALLAFLGLLPKILATAPEVIILVNRLLDAASGIKNLIGEQQLKSWISDLENTIDDLKKAQTPDDKLKVARDLSRLINGL